MSARDAIPRGAWLMVVALWGVFLAGMYWADKLKFFQASPYLYFTGAAGLLLVLLAAKGVFRPSRAVCACGRAHEPGDACPAGADGRPGAEAPRAADDGRGLWVMLKGIALVLFVMLPVLVGLLVPHRSLNALAAMKRGMGLDSANLLDVYRSRRRDWAAAAGEYKPANTLDVLEIGRDQPGLKVRTIGFVYRSDDMADDLMSIARFKITCCAADATPVAVAVRWADAARLRNDTWVEVRGAVERQTVKGREVTVIVVDPAEREKDGVLEVEAPDQPYI